MLLLGPQPTSSAEVVSRPDPGIARGKWEAPAWAFWVALALVLAFVALYTLRRMGKLRRPATRSPSSIPPPSSRRHR